MTPIKFRPGIGLTVKEADALNEIQRWIGNRRASLAITENDIRPSEKFDAAITDVDTGNYSWTRQAFDTDGNYIDDPVVYEGTATVMPAKERNDKVATDFPFFAELTRRISVDGQNIYEFDLITTSGGGSFEVEEVDGTPSTTTILKFPNTLLTDNMDGTVTVKSASATETGLVNTTTQSFSGVKTFGSGNHYTEVDGGTTDGAGVFAKNLSDDLGVHVFGGGGSILIFGQGGGGISGGGGDGTITIYNDGLASDGSFYTIFSSVNNNASWQVTGQDSFTDPASVGVSLVVDNSGDLCTLFLAGDLPTAYGIGAARGTTVNWNKITNSNLTIVGGIITGYS